MSASATSNATAVVAGFDLPPGGTDPGVFIEMDGVNCTTCVQSGSVTRRLNRPAQATLRMFTDCAPGDANSTVKITIAGNLFFHGFVTQISTEAGEDGNLMSEYTAMDPMFLWNFRPARSGPASLDPADFSNPKLFSDPSVNGKGPQILAQILLQSEDDSNPADGEGPLYIDVGGGSYAAGIDGLLLADPTDFPMTIMEVFQLMTSTGALDAVLTPIDSGGNMASITVVNGDYGNNHSNFTVADKYGNTVAGDGTVSFEYQTGGHNVRTLRMTEDSSNIVNKLWYYLGPRRKTAEDPAGDQHWAANIQGRDPGLAYPPGGRSFDDTNTPFGPPWTDNELGERIYNSRLTNGVRMDIQIFDAQGDENPASFRELYRRLWQEESWLKSIPRVLVHVTPVRTSDFDLLPPDVTPVTFGSFDIGDLVTVTAGSVVRGGFTGAQRIYEYTVSFDEDGILELGELLTSSDGDGAQS